MSVKPVADILSYGGSEGELVQRALQNLHPKIIQKIY
jgi:hypothetical protein